jgi:formate dehydrogenase subunit delta
MSPEKLVYMTNQRADKAVADIAEHLQNFGDLRMRSAIFAHIEAGG